MTITPIVQINRVPAGGLCITTPDGREFRAKTMMVAIEIATREAARIGCAFARPAAR